MDGFPSFFKKDEEWSKLGIESQELERIVSELLKEFNVQLKELETSIETDDITAVCVNALGEETKSLVRVRSYRIGLTDEDVEDLYEDMLETKATSALFITDSHFTKEAKKFAKHVPIRLMDGVELGKVLSAQAPAKAEFSFLTAFSEDEVVRYFKKYRLKKFLRIIGTHEGIEEIDKRYMPVGHFAVKKVTRDVEKTKNIYVDLSSGNIFNIRGNRVEENNFFKKILDLPEESQEHLLDLIKYGKLRRKYIEGKPVNILEKENLVNVEERGRVPSTLDIIMDEITSTVKITTSEVSTLKHKTPEEEKINVETHGYVKEILNKPVIDTSYDLKRFIESSIETNTEFDPDPVHYNPEKVAYVLDNIYPGEDISFVEMAYLPYYRCKYVSEYGAVRFKKLFTPRFKRFVPTYSPSTWIYQFIDTFPAIPYLLIALAYLLLNLDKWDEVIHILAVAFIFITVAVLVGVLLKVIFRTERRMPRYGNTIIRYGFPSIHALTSSGAVAFAYFVDPLLALLLVPISLLYIYSRLKLGVHSETDIIGGLIVGVSLGILFGLYVIDKIQLPDDLKIVETILAALFFIVPLIVTVFETQYR
ncbi:MAG: restriction endonuclease [Candidatus Altiarchaeota archaeon]|nr:restriction endonuclease [Candidatus Altiarchaeota archaeon]